jgi:hypothetical protein
LKAFNAPWKLFVRRVAKRTIRPRVGDVDASFRLFSPLIALRELNWRWVENVCVAEMPWTRATTPRGPGNCAIRSERRV